MEEDDIFLIKILSIVRVNFNVVSSTEDIIIGLFHDF